MLHYKYSDLLYLLDELATLLYDNFVLLYSL